MANTFTGLIQVMYAAMQVVSRERVGFIGAVSMEALAERAGLNQPITSPIVGEEANADIVPGNVSPEGTDLNPTMVELRISKQRKQSFHLTGEEYMSLMSSGTWAPITQARIEQAIRKLVNEVEADLAAEYVYASRAYGTAGTAPFGTANDLSDLTQTMRILDDNGAPMSGRSLVLSSAANANLLGKQPAFHKVNEAGTDMMRRRALYEMEFGAYVGVSRQLKEHVASAALAGVMLNGGEPVGETALVVDGAGSSETQKAGDFVTLAGDESKYVIAADAAASFTTLNIGKPGLQEAGGDNTAITGNTANYVPSVAFSRDAIHLAMRLPALPPEGDMGTHMSLPDPYSGMMFELSHYPQYRQASYEIAACWGVLSPNPQHMALLLG